MITLLMIKNNFLLSSIRNISKEIISPSHRLMLKTGMIKQVSSGIYSFLPIGVKVLSRLVKFIKNELNLMNFQEVIMPILQPKSLWQHSIRYRNINCNNLQSFNIDIDNGYILPISGEEIMTEIFKHCSNSYKDINKILYQVNWKFRNELRPKRGLIRSKEFLMQDAYSFDIDPKKALYNYEKTLKLYLLILKKLNLLAIPVLANNKGIGGLYSHEIHILSKYGDEIIFYEDYIISYLNNSNFCLSEYENLYARNSVKHNMLYRNKCTISKNSSIEVGHVFYLDDIYSKNFNFVFKNSRGLNIAPKMCCYGIGLTRLLSVIVDNSYNGNRIIWPKYLVPFEILVLNMSAKDYQSISLSNTINSTLSTKYDVIYLTLNKNNSQQVKNIQIIGINFRIIVRSKYSKNSIIELFHLKSEKAELVKIDNLLYRIKCLKGFEPLSIDP